MIPECGQKLDFDNIDERQMQLFGEKCHIELQRSLTSVRYKILHKDIDMDSADIDVESISNAFRDGNQVKAIEQICAIIKTLQKRIEELEKK